ncbi:hypothetical protein [Methylopila sp. M107]|uniref:hypothetical protein n=1 Tax=Methylopila sp. M107 TaxID=1101190 RepID=UPI0003732B1C|nr:hypothetical protein [Methylopila sp. M107]
MSEASPRDLTRWNRAGLSRFAYVDGNAAVWLDELRLAMLARYARGASGEARTEDYWRELSSRELKPQDAADAKANAARLAWAALFDGLPAKPETTRRRNERLLALYAQRSPDQAQEIMRAFARAAHVLLGHVDAYANEGYLRTATQWDSMRKLAAMIGYQPTPGAAAGSVVALIVGPAEIGRVEVARGVSMSFTPPGGGKPVVFETVETIDAHPALNAARALGFDHNDDDFDPGLSSDYVAPKGAKPKPGDVAVVLSSGGVRPAVATLLKTVSLSDDKSIATIELAPATGGGWVKFTTHLLTKPEKVQKPRARSSGGNVVVSVQNTGLLQIGAIVLVTIGGVQKPVKVISAVDGRVELEGLGEVSGPIELTMLNRYDVKDDHVVTPNSVGKVWFETGSGFSEVEIGSAEIAETLSASGTGKVFSGASKDIYRRFAKPAGAQSVGYTLGSAVAKITATVVGAPPPVFHGSTDQSAIEFVGKPSANLVAGSWFVARELNGSALHPLIVTGVRIEAESHFIAFGGLPQIVPTAYEFHGPMTEDYRPLDFDRGQNPVYAGGIVLTGLSAATKKLVKVGRKIIVEDERKNVAPPLLLTVASVLDVQPPAGSALEETAELRITVVESPSVLAGRFTGWTVFRLNTTRATHGETRGPKTLGSGNGERFRQSFNLAVKDVTFTPSTAAESGVAPDIDVAVQDVLWGYRDLSDPTAEGTDSWSSALREDDTIDILFRRRLPTGNNNVAVTRHRVGGGPAGNAVPAYGFLKPAKKHRHVTDIVQPFAASGGSEREPVSSMRQSAPARLSANGRAVSLADFEKLAARHASVWQARALQLPEVGAAIRLIVVAASGGAVDGAFKDVLSAFIRQRAIPDVRLEIEGFESVPVEITAHLRVDVGRYDKDDVGEAALAALVETFSLRRRGLGQSFLVGEVLAALEKVEGVETAVADVALGALSPRWARLAAFRSLDPSGIGLKTFKRFYGAPDMARPPLTFDDGRIKAIFPDVNQVAYVPDAGFVTVLTEAV